MHSGERLVLGIEGSANKIGVGIVTSDGAILANVRRTFVPKTGSGFQPRETARHHQKHVASLIEEALHTAGVRPTDLCAVAYTKGPVSMELSRSRTEASRVRLRGGSPGARNETQVEDPSTMEPGSTG
jgi:N6-L-threonylcarbamoyladenine synthase